VAIDEVIGALIMKSPDHGRKSREYMVEHMYYHLKGCTSTCHILPFHIITCTSHASHFHDQSITHIFKGSLQQRSWRQDVLN